MLYGCSALMMNRLIFLQTNLQQVKISTVFQHIQRQMEVSPISANDARKASFQLLMEYLKADDHKSFMKAASPIIMECFPLCQSYFGYMRCFQTSFKWPKDKKQKKQLFLDSLAKLYQDSYSSVEDNQASPSSLKPQISFILSQMLILLREFKMNDCDTAQALSWVRARLYMENREFKQALQYCHQMIKDYQREKYRLLYVEILVEAQLYNDAEFFINKRINLLAKQRPLPKRDLSQYYLYRYMSMVGMNKSLYQFIIYQTLKKSVDLNPDNKLANQHLLAYSLIYRVTYGYQKILEQYERRFQDQYYTLPLRAYLALSINLFDEMREYMTVIKKILNEDPLGEYRFFEYTHYMNQINLTLNPHQIHAQTYNNIILFKVLQSHDVIGQILYRSEDYIGALAHFTEVSNQIHGKNMSAAYYKTMLCERRLNLKSKVLMKLQKTTFDNITGSFFMVYFAKIYSRFLPIEKLKTVLSILNNRSDLVYLEKIEIIIIKLVNSSQLRVSEKQLLDEAYKIVYKSSTQKDCSIGDFFIYFHLLHFLAHYSFEKNYLVKGKVFVQKLGQILLIMNEVSPIGAEALRSKIGSRGDIEIQLII